MKDFAMPSKWKEIGTAPKDGTVIDLWLVDQSGNGWRQTDAYWVEQREGVIHWADTSRGVRSGWWAPKMDYDSMDGFCDFGPKARSGSDLLLSVQPTHWMPTPCPPKNNE